MGKKQSTRHQFGVGGKTESNCFGITDNSCHRSFLIWVQVATQEA